MLTREPVRVGSTPVEDAVDIDGECYGDVLLGTHNVNVIRDTVNDLAYGLGGALIYTVVFRRFGFTQQRRAKPDER